MNTPKDLEIVTISDASKLILANQLLSSLREKDWGLLAAIVTEDITWSLPGESQLSGIATGLAEFIDRAKTIMSYEISLQLNNIQPSYTGFALSVNNRAERNGFTLDENIAVVCTLRGSKIASTLRRSSRCIIQYFRCT